MRFIRSFFITMVALSLFFSYASATEKEFDSEQMLSDIESQLDLNREQLSHLKPAIDAKSAELKKRIHESIDKGFVQLDELSETLNRLSRDAEKKAAEVLNSDEMDKLKAYLHKIDKKAIAEMKDKAVADFSAFLELTEEQMEKLKPVLEESYTQLAEIFAGFAKEGGRSWEEFKQQYDQFSGDLKEKLQDTLDKKQMEKLEKYNEENKVRVRKVLYSV